MTLRTPRRRVSPRTKKRYRAIKDFFKRAIGSPSQTDIVINSNIAVNVSDLKHKITGLEKQLSEVSRSCREYIYLNCSNVPSQSNVSISFKEFTPIQKESVSGKELQPIETETLYYKSGDYFSKSDGSDYMPNCNKTIDYGIENNKLKDKTGKDIKDKKTKMKKSKVESRVKDFDMKQNFSEHHVFSAQNDIKAAYSFTDVSSHAELREIRHRNPGYSGDQVENRAHKREHNDHTHRRPVIQNEPLLQKDYGYRTDKFSNNRKHKRRTNDVDKNFIADIIQKQYKPITMFGRRDSDLSQLSEPLCRDRERTVGNIYEDTKLCSCCYGNQNCPKILRRHVDSDTRSVCDTRLYSSKRLPRQRHRKTHADAYNSELYDLVPVKEKSSPKSRRKFAHDNFANSHTYREVPPSPRSHRPRLNLKAQYHTEENDCTNTAQEHGRRVSPKKHQRYQKHIETFDSDTSGSLSQTIKNIEHKEVIRQHQGTMSSLHHVTTEVADTNFNRTQDAVSSADKTDQALCEIKDILQTFLLEIKKEASTSGKSDVSSKSIETKLVDVSQDPSANIGVNSSSFNNYSAPQCNIASTPFMPPYMNPCCYPVLPVYPVNPMNPMKCMQNGYTTPVQSFTCGCPNKPDDSAEIIKTNTGTETLATETDELIKEIFKCVAQSPTFFKKHEASYKKQPKDRSENKNLTSRSAGGSGPVYKHDAKVGTMVAKCYSQSCEAMGSRILADTYEHYNETTESYSDTILESLETTAISSSKAELSTEPSDDKTKKTTFSKLLKSLGMFKKKQDFDSESTIEVDIKKKTPYRQEVTNYAVHGQEYYQPPPERQDHRACHHQEPKPPTTARNHCSCHHHEPFMPASARDHRSCHQDKQCREARDYHPPNYPMHNPPQQDSYYEPGAQQTPRSPQYHTGHHTAPPYNYNHYNQMQTQIPLCLKEIEVKTMGTQSERKISFFDKIKKKIQTPVDLAKIESGRNLTSQTANPAEAPAITKLGFWKTLQAKAMEGKPMEDPIAYSYKKHKNFADGDKKIRNAMLKKMFLKRNPLSPQNLLIKTILKKEHSSFGDSRLNFQPRWIL